MTQIEGNKLIAEFMEQCGLEEKRTPSEGIVRNEAKYHTSWDWQVPAWCKVNSELVKLSMTEEIASKQNDLFDKYCQCVSANDVMQAWSYLVEAIQFYNNQPSLQADKNKEI